MANETNPLTQIHRQIMWNRLIAVVEEQARIMIRTAFSTTVREAGDLSAGVFDLHGRMLAQAVTGTPGHVNSMAESVGHFLKKFPVGSMNPGDHYITNDPWLGTGHLHDLTVVSPAFYKGKIVGLFANTAHVIDIGGLGMGPEGRSVFEEGMLQNASIKAGRTRHFSTSCARARACRLNSRGTFIPSVRATTPAHTA
jgi:N-methylhydantoinase B